MTHIHVAIFKWKDGVTTDRINAALAAVLVIGDTAESITAYRDHPDHVKVAAEIDAMEDQGIGVDFSEP